MKIAEHQPIDAQIVPLRQIDERFFVPFRLLDFGASDPALMTDKNESGIYGAAE